MLRLLISVTSVSSSWWPGWCPPCPWQMEACPQWAWCRGGPQHSTGQRQGWHGHTYTPLETWSPECPTFSPVALPVLACLSPLRIQNLSACMQNNKQSMWYSIALLPNMTVIWQHDIVVADVQMYHTLGMNIVKSLQQLLEYAPAHLLYTSHFILLPVCQHIMFLLLSVDQIFIILLHIVKVCSSLSVWMLCLPDKWEGPAPDRDQPLARSLPHPHSNPDLGEVSVM